MGNPISRRISISSIFACGADARIAEMAETYQHPAEVIEWYKQDPQRLSGIESEVLEENVVAWVLARAKVTEKAIDFDEIMGQQGV